MLKKIEVGALAANCYILSCDKTKETVIIDPGGDYPLIKKELERGDFQIKYILATHCHFDHIGAVGEVKREYSADFLIHKLDEGILKRAASSAKKWGISISLPPSPDGYLIDGQILRFGQVKLKIMHSPGHSPGSVCFYDAKKIFTGDTLFLGSVGRWDFPGGSLKDLAKSVKKILSLNENLKVYPGHGPETTIEKEKRNNYFIKYYSQ